MNDVPLFFRAVYTIVLIASLIVLGLDLFIWRP